MRMDREKGVALITSLMVLLLISAIVVGMCWMVMTDQRLGGNNSEPRAGVLRRRSRHGKADHRRCQQVLYRGRAHRSRYHRHHCRSS